MRKLFKTAPKLDENYYKSGDYENPIHHSKNKKTFRLYAVAGLINFLRDNYDVNEITDLGCGDGGLLDLIYKDDISYNGIDLSEANIEYAKDKWFDYENIDFLYEDFTTYNIIENELIVCCETLEHLVNPKRLLKSLYCNYLIASVPMNESINRHGKHHLWAWNEQEFRKTIQDCGFKIMHTARVNERTQIVLAEKL